MKNIICLILMHLYLTTNAEIHITSSNYNIDKISGDYSQYSPAEIGIQLPKKITDQIDLFTLNNNKGINPFDTEKVQIVLILTDPNNKKRQTFGFYYQETFPNKQNTAWITKKTKYPWRIRFTPDIPGEWKGEILISYQNVPKEKIANCKFTCLPTIKKGRIVSHKNSSRLLSYTNTTESFFGVGHNIAHAGYNSSSPKSMQQHLSWIKELHAAGGNFFRIELGGANALPNWDSFNNYSSKMGEMNAFDHIFNYSTKNQLYFILFRHHTEVYQGEDWDQIRWSKNPYKNANITPKSYDYFTNPKAIKWQQNVLTYIFSRWSHHPSFALFEYQEIDNWIKLLQKEENISQLEALKIIQPWLKSHFNFLKKNFTLHCPLLTGAYASIPPKELSRSFDGIFKISDVIGYHKYGESKDVNYKSKFNVLQDLWKTHQKPVFVEEMGARAFDQENYLSIYCCDDQEFLRNIWSTSLMGTFSSGLHWWWDRGIHANNLQRHYKSLYDFIKKNNLNFQNRQSEVIPKKWHNSPTINKSSTMNYYLVSKDNKMGYGWANKIRYFWKNDQENPCLKHFSANGYLKQPCLYYDNYLLPISKNKPAPTNKMQDYYSNKSLKKEKSVFKIQHLKRNWFRLLLPIKKHYYEVCTFETSNTNNLRSTMHIKASPFGTLKIPLEERNTAYTFEYLGKKFNP